jgi:hypothetical protein
MTPIETAARTAEGIVTLGTAFMMDGDTYTRGAELGFTGLDFYIVGRGGVLGDVDADIVVACFGYFEPTMIRTNWEAGTKVLGPRRAAEEFAACGHRFAERRFPDDLDVTRLADLAGRVVESASAAGAPLFAGWRRLPVAGAPKARALHHLNALRELRGGLHIGAVRAAGLRPLDAVLVKAPVMAGLYGWPEPYDDVSALGDTWQHAEDGTNRAMADAFSVLDARERAELCHLVGAVHAAVTNR